MAFSFANGLSGYSLVDYMNAVNSAAQIQANAYKEVGEMAKDIAKMNIDYLEKTSADSKAVLAPYVAAGKSGVEGLKSYIQTGQTATNALMGVLGYGKSEAPVDYYQNERNRLQGVANQANSRLQTYLQNGYSQDSPEVKALEGQLKNAQDAWGQFNSMFPTPGPAPSGNQEQQTALNTMLNSPMIQSQLKFGLQGVQNKMAAQGLTGSGNTLAALQDYGQGLAANQINNYMSALSGISQTGAQAASSLASIGGNAATGTANVSNQLGQAVSAQNNQSGEIQSNAILGAAGAQANALMSNAQMSLNAAMSMGGGMGGGGGGGDLFGMLGGAGAMGLGSLLFL